MNVNSISTRAGKDGALPCVAQFISILLVDHDTTSLMTLATQFEEQLYKVTTTESATIALSLFEERNNYYDIVVADISMPEMGISEFVEKLHGHRKTVPIILIDEDLKMDSAREALHNGVCYVFPKTPSHRDIATVWQHIPRVTGQMPASFDMTNYIDKKKDGSSSSDAGNQKRDNSEMKLINTVRENMKRKKNPIAENFNSSNDTEEDGDNSKKPRLTWTPYLDDKFLQAINILGEHGARPKTILRLMNVPGLTDWHVSSHLQRYRKQKRQSLNVQKIACPFMPAVLPAAPPLKIFEQGKSSCTANSKCAAAPNFVHYSFAGVKQNQDAFNYSSNYNVKAIINNAGVQVQEGNGGGSNGLQAPTREPAGASGLLRNGLEASNEKPAGEFGTVLCDFGNAGNLGNMNNNNLGDGTSVSNQQFDGMPSNDVINQIMQELEASEDIWDLIN